MDTINFRGWFCNTSYGRLTEEERYHNGMKLAQALYNYGWTEESIAGILGNVEPECGLSPATIESNPFDPDYIPSNQEILDRTTYYGGLGFVQWTPGRTELVQWAEDTNQMVWYDGLTQVKRFKYEYDTHYWPWWTWYVTVHSPPEDCAEFFCRRYCRPQDPDATVPNRRREGLKWFNRIHDKLHRPVDWFIYTKQSREGKELKPPCRRI